MRSPTWENIAWRDQAQKPNPEDQRPGSMNVVLKIQDHSEKRPETIINNKHRSSLVVQWLGLHASTAGGMGSIPGWGTKIPQAIQCAKKIKN